MSSVRRCSALFAVALGVSPVARAQTVVSPITPVTVSDPGKANAGGSKTIIIAPSGGVRLTPTKPAAAPTQQGPLVVGNVSSPQWGQIGKLTSSCGGLDDKGAAQSACTPTPATFEGDAASGCPAGSFRSTDKRTCLSCPPGYRRYHLARRDGPNACAKPDPSVRETFYSAKFAAPRHCPTGTFYDPLEGGGCWSCPPNTHRSAAVITAPDACVGKGMKSPATAAWEHGCQEGEFLDPRNGGECWSCPGSSVRSAFPVDGPKACYLPAGKALAKADDVGDRHCPAGQIYDLARRSNGNVAARVRAQIASGASSDEWPESVPADVSGSCWSCPVGAKRTAAPVWADNACGPQPIGIVPARYEQPGLFRLDGAEEVALALVKDGALIESIAASLATATGQTEANMKKLAWQDIAASPQTSEVLLGAVYSRVAAAALDPQHATDAEKRLAKSFAEAARRHRAYVAQTALDAWLRWDEAQSYYRGRRAQDVTSAYDLGTPPPFEKISVKAAAAAAAGASVPLTLALAATLFVPPVRKVVLPFRDRKGSGPNAEAGKPSAAPESPARPPSAPTELGVSEDVITAPVDAVVKEEAEQVASRITARVAAQAAKRAAGRVASILLGVGMAAGESAGFIAAGVLAETGVGLIVEIIQFGAQQAIQVAYAKPKLEANLALASAPFDLPRMLGTDEGEAEVRARFCAVMSGAAAPMNIAAIAALADGRSGGR